MKRLTTTVASVREHYEKLLSHHYSRMFGEFEAKVAEQRVIVASAQALDAGLLTADDRVLCWPGSLVRHDARK